MALINFAEWRPDLPNLSQWAREATNAVPAAESYRPLPSLATVSNALGARAQGAAWFRGIEGNALMLAGDATKLYVQDNDTLWTDASRTTGGVYATPAENAWRFAQFGILAIAVNGLDVPQKFDLAAGGNFTALGGTPPIAAYIAIVREFVMLGNLGDLRQRVQWSAYNNAELTWGTNPSTQADVQDLPDGGDITGLVGGENCLIFQEAAIRRMTYEGPPVIFRIDKIATDVGCSVPGSVASLVDVAFFLHKSGFYMISGGQKVTPIGRDKVDRTFWAEFDESNAHRCSATVEPIGGLYMFAYPSNGSGGTPNRMLIYNWTTGFWSRAVLDLELVFNGITQNSYNLEQLDAFGNLDTLPYSLDSTFWVGVVSLQLFGFDTSHKSGAFSGPALQAAVETAEINTGKGTRSVIRSCRPLIDGGAPTISVGSRETQQGAVAYGAAVGLTAAGMAPTYVSGRYFRIRAVIPAGSTWRNAQGIDDLDVRPAGFQ
jgi:hypothetical protein